MTIIVLGEFHPYRGFGVPVRVALSTRHLRRIKLDRGKMPMALLLIQA